MWVVESGDGTTSFYQQSIDEACHMLEDMAKYDYWHLTCSTNNQGWETIQILWTCFDTQPQEKMEPLQNILTQGLEKVTEFQDESFIIMQHTEAMV